MGKNHSQTCLWCLGGIYARAQRAPWRRESAGIHPVRIFSEGEAFSCSRKWQHGCGFCHLRDPQSWHLTPEQDTSQRVSLGQWHLWCVYAHVCARTFLCVFSFLWFPPVTKVPGPRTLLRTLAAVVTPGLAACALCYPLSPTLPPLRLSGWEFCSFRPSHLCKFQILARHCTAVRG